MVFHGYNSTHLRENMSNHTAAQATANVNTPAWGFFALPVEVRNIIYDLLITKAYPKDDIRPVASRVSAVLVKFPSWLKDFADASGQVGDELLPLVLRQYSWVADLFFNDIADGDLHIANNFSWLKRADRHFLDGNIHHVSLRLRHWLLSQQVRRTEPYFKIGEIGIFAAYVDIQLLESVPHLSMRARVHIRLPDSTQEDALKATLTAALDQDVGAQLQRLVSEKQAAGSAQTCFTIADWNRVVDTLGTTIAIWFKAYDWTPWE